VSSSFFVTGGVQTIVPALVTEGVSRISPLHVATLGLRAERVDVAGSLCFHPFDVALQSALTAIAGYVFFFIAVFQHVNVRTPRWLGWFILRPEQHAMHHERDVHDHNHGSFAFMDLICGTFENPEGFIAEAGFYDGSSARLGEMLRGRDVNAA
jgi:hypothetical protein